MSGTPSPAPQRVRRPRRRWFEWALLAAGTMATLISLLTAGALAFFLSKVDDITAIPIPSIEPAEVGEPSNWLLVGSDSRDGIDENDPNAGLFLGDDVPGGKRTDTIIIARVDPANQVIDLVSIPRDLWVPIVGGGESRINSAFNGEDGEQRLVDTIESYFGFEINHYAEVDFVGFQDIVDALGGVPIWFDQPMRDPNSGLNVTSAGCVVLDGSMALAFARSRHLEYFQDGAWRTDPTGDLGRTARQQYFVSQVAATATSKLDVTNLGTINRLLDAGGESLVIDDGAGADDLLELARTFSSVSDEQIRGHALPVYDFRASNNAAVLGLETELAQPVLDIFRGTAVPAEDAARSADAETIPVVDYQVLNGSGVAGQAAEVAESLGAAGYQISEVGNADPADLTTIRYPSGAQAAAEQLAAQLVGPVVLEADPTISAVVILITGADFEGVASAAEAPNGGTTAETEDSSPAAEIEEPPLVGVVPGPSPEGTACA